ncbi:hypothetical protein DEF23_18215 [Marinitenerispora sediminis]|uniref:Uncharacterized protein n=1 Tax=Marinitenerispora sediminis TaxID=1931232 RepID=A0A368TAF1_9ACTN|nr:hypothetical protein DEF28_20385 [Marinitenerispora sediminis]RCV53063.1 hypothetical protein DEF23_18215 [Marinitenerispora sediminis]RCV59808.1 hypothetical protein DEF24_08860 [Marinitenerispora sediminis]
MSGTGQAWRMPRRVPREPRTGDSRPSAPAETATRSAKPTGPDHLVPGHGTRTGRTRDHGRPEDNGPRIG